MDVNKIFYWTFLIYEFTFLTTASSQVFGPSTIVSRNCTHLSIKADLQPPDILFVFLWMAVTFNGTSNKTEPIVQVSVVAPNETFLTFNGNSVFSSLYSLRFYPPKLDTLPSPFSSTLTLALPPDNNTLKYWIGLSFTYDQFNLLSISPSFEKPRCNLQNNQGIICEDQPCLCDSNVTKVCSKNVNLTGQCLYSGNFLIDGKCPQEPTSSSLSTSYWWIYVLVGGSGLIVLGGGAVIVKRKFKNKRQKSTIDNEEAKSLQETEA